MKHFFRSTFRFQARQAATLLHGTLALVHVESEGKFVRKTSSASKHDLVDIPGQSWILGSNSILAKR
jgi:hypothetical protein